MGTLSLENFKLNNEDILVEVARKNDIFTDRKIHVIEHEERNEKLNWFRVVKVSAKASKHVKKGDLVILQHLDHTPPFDLDGQRVAVTDMSKVVGFCD